MADQGAVIFVIVGQTIISVSAVFAWISITIPFDNRNGSYKTSEAYQLGGFQGHILPQIFILEARFSAEILNQWNVIEAWNYHVFSLLKHFKFKKYIFNKYDKHVFFKKKCYNKFN